MKFNNREIKDLVFAGLLLSLAFAILLSGGYQAFSSFNSGFFVIFGIAFLTAGLGFLFHELMHKYVAQSYNLDAEFYASYGGLALAVGLSFFGFIIAAPGAVHIQGFNITKEKNGKISLAGPMTNLVLALVFFFGILFLWFFEVGGIWRNFFSIGLTINSLLAAFNMIPVMPFDGAKIKEWNGSVYWSVVGVSVGLFILSFFI